MKLPKFLKRFRRRQPINEDWRVGDMAQCVIPADEKWLPPSFDPKRGAVLRVLDVDLGRDSVDGCLGWCLKLSGFRDYYDATGFIKITPSSEAFARQMRACKPRKVDA